MRNREGMHVEQRHRSREGPPQVVHRPVLAAFSTHQLDVVLRRADHMALVRVGVAEYEVVDLGLEPACQDGPRQRYDWEHVVLPVLGVAEHHVPFLRSTSDQRSVADSIERLAVIKENRM